jgi:hypothetical protein
MKIFWSWQSDTPGKVGRHFVRDALNAAIEQLKQTPDVEEPTEREARSAMHLDQDRKGISGSPDLARVILEKIEQSGVFVADVTPIGSVTTRKDEAQPKKLINANVAIELGYALHALSDRSLLMVMNEHYGSRSDLPFDLQSKAGPIMFNLSASAGKEEIFAASRKLTAELKEALALCATRHVETIRRQTPFPEAGSAHNRAMYFDRAEVLATSGYPNENEYRFAGDKTAYLRLFPCFDNQPRTSLAKMVSTFQAERPMPFSAASGGICGRNRFGPIIYDPTGGGIFTMDGLTQGLEGGELWGVTGVVFQPMWQRAGLSTKEIFGIPFFEFEKIYVRTLRNYVKVATMIFGFQPPFTVKFGAVGINGVHLAKPGRLYGPMMQNEIHKSCVLESDNDGEIMGSLRDYFNDFYDLMAVARSEILSDQEVSAHDLPHR